ncbi:MAG: gamma-glutamyltransferase family protein [Lentisphaerae bacterium]|nr:gamma-glutamyltransferase family protein [Lentisphaerota bacterium]
MKTRIMQSTPATVRGWVASETRESAQAGVALLAAGGNAVDAAVATAIAETVVSPHNAGIGGFAGAMMIYRADRGETVALKFDTIAPRQATPDMFVGKRDQHRAGALSVGVPGVLRGLEAAVRQFGCRPWAEAVAPAQRLASEGFDINRLSAGMIAAYREQLPDYPATAAMLMPRGRPPAPGERMRFPDLARTLERLAQQGADLFYAGDLGEQTVRFLQSQGGILSKEDLAEYQPEVGAPLTVSIGDYQYLTPTLPGGGITTLHMLRILDQLPKPSRSRPSEDPDYLHMMLLTMKLAWRDRLTHMADPACMPMPPEDFLSDAHLAEQARRVLSDDVPEDFDVPADFSCTSHVTTADAAGNLATLTYTHGFAYGSMVTIPGTGLILGHGMARFDGVPGRPNSVAPGKKALHNMVPLIVGRRGRPYAAIGWTGGRRIPNVVLQVLNNLIRFRLPLADALAEPNLHTEGANPIKAERAFPPATLDALRARGHVFERQDAAVGFGSAIVWDDARHTATAATDPRRDGVVATG